LSKCLKLTERDSNGEWEGDGEWDVLSFEDYATRSKSKSIVSVHLFREKEGQTFVQNSTKC